MDAAFAQSVLNAAPVLLLGLAALLALQLPAARWRMLWDWARVGGAALLRQAAPRELAAITLVSLTFSGSFLLPALDARYSPGGREHERLAGILIPVELGLRYYQQIPTWNSQMNSGVPLLGNAFNYLFNPFASVPVLLLGAVQGTKAALAIALLLAGWNGWALGRALGMGGAGRVLVGALYMMSGGIAGKADSGHFQLILSLAWLPLVLAGVVWTLRGTDRRAPALMAAAFALMFFAGNIYYTLHALVCAAVLAALHLMERDGSRWRVRWDTLRRLATGATFAVGLAALQFVMVWVVRDYVAEGHYGDPGLAGAYSLQQAAVNLVYPLPQWAAVAAIPNAGGVTMLTVADYAYIGLLPFALIAAAGVALMARPALQARVPGRTAAGAFGLALVMMVWGAGQTPVLAWLYANVPLLAEFRFVGRAHAVAGLWWIVLAGYALDVLWNAAGSEGDARAQPGRGLLRAAGAAVGLWAAWWGFSALDEGGRLALLAGSMTLRNALEPLRVTDARLLGSSLLTWLMLAPGIYWLANVPVRVWTARGRARLWALAWRAGALATACAAAGDLMSTNASLYWQPLRRADFAALYDYVRTVDPTAPLLMMTEPDTQGTMFQTYYAGARHRYLDEGWIPGAVPGELALGLGLRFHDLPRWAIVFNSDSDFLALNSGYQYVAQQCTRDVPGQDPVPPPIPDFPCNFYGQVNGILYENDTSLPYAFVASEPQLALYSNTLTGRDVTPPVWVDYRQDTLNVIASAPDDGTLYYLVVLESHFPGWKATAAGVPVETVTALRYVAVPLLAGTHTYTLRYQPPGLALGTVIFLVTLAALTRYLLVQRKVS